MDEVAGKKRVRKEIDQARKWGVSEAEIAETQLQEQDKENETKRRKDMIESLTIFREKLMAKGREVKLAAQEAINKLEEMERLGK